MGFGSYGDGGVSNDSSSDGTVLESCGLEAGLPEKQQRVWSVTAGVREGL